MKSIALQFIVNFIQFFSSICLIEGSFIENGKKLLIDQLYTEYILSPSLAYSSEIRACIKRMISIEYYDGLIGVSFRQMNNLGHQNIEKVMNHFKGTLNEFNESVKVKGIERLVDRDVCRFWALHRHMKQFHVKLIQFGEMITQNSIERFYAIFLEPNQCARLNHIRKTKDSKDKKWLMDFECDLADGHLFMLEEMLQNWHYAKQRKLAQVFLEQKADWENELTYRLRMIGYLKNLEDPNFLKTVAKHRMEELFDFFEWHYLLYAQLFAVEPSELSRIKAAMELFAYFHAIEMLFEQKAHPKSIWPTLRLDIAKIFDSINSGTTKLFSLNESTDKARQLLAQVSKLKADFLQKKKAFVASSSKHTEALENPQLEADISRIRAELEHLITVEKTAAQNSEMFQILANLSELKLDMELYIKGIPYYELNKINNIVTIQDELSQMHAEMVEKLANFNEEFCQKLHALCGVELTKRFSVLLSQTQLAKIWPTVRMCRMKEAVNAGGWLQLTHEPSISFKNGEDTIEYHDDDASALAQSYKELFTNHELFSSSKSKFSSSTQHHQIQNMDILLKAAIWLGNNLIDEFLLFVDTMFEKENAVINQLLNNLWTLWDLLLKGTNEMDLARKSCCIYNFGMGVIKAIWTNANKNERIELREMFKKKRWTEMTMINANEIDGIFTPHLSSIQLNCNAAQIAEHLNQLKDSPNYELVHSLTLFRLMKRLTQFRNIFSGSAEYVEAIKRSLFVVLGSPQEFELLEKMFPEHLHIDWLDKGYRVALYSNMLQQRSWSDEAQRAEMRMASSMLLRHLNVQLSAKTTIGTIDPMDVLRMHEIVKAKVYANIDKVEGVCWMMYLLNMMNRNGTFVVPSEPLVVYCVHEGARLHGFIAHWDKIQQWHYDFLTESKNGTPILVLMKHKVPGTMTRLWRLLGDKLFSELCKQYKEVCQYDASNKAFDDEHVLMYHYRRSIVFSEKVCAIDQLNSKLAADMLVFIRWFDAEPKSAKMATFWRAKREELKEEYDEIFDANLNDGLTQKILTFVQSCHSMKKLLIECRNWVNEKEMKEAWKKMLQRLANNDDRHRKHSGEGAERQRHAAFVEGKDWLNNLHAEELKKFLGFTNDGGEHKPVNEEQKKPREHFARIMREGLTKLMNARIQLLDFVGVKEAVNIFKMLGIKSELDDLDDELFKDAHIQDSGEKKNKKKKKKQKKKTKMTNSENDKATTTISEDKMSNDKEMPANAENVERIENFGEKITTNNKMNKKQSDNDKMTSNDNDDKDRMPNGEVKVGTNKEIPTEVNDDLTKRENCKMPAEPDTESAEIFQNEMSINYKSENCNVKKAKNRGAKAKRNKSAKNDGIDVKNNDEMTARCHHIIDEIKEDEFLLGQYLQLLSNPSAFNVGLRRTLLEMSIYSNEIWHRIEVLKHFAKSALQFLHWPEHFESKWRELKEKNVSDMEEEELKMKLYQMLRHISANLDNVLYKNLANCAPENENDSTNFKISTINSTNCIEKQNQWCIIGEKLHRNKLAKALMASAELKNAWDKLTKADQICVITVIFVAENNNRKLKEAKRKSVGKYMEKWGQTLQQIRMDQHIFEMFDQKGLLNVGQKPAEWREHIEYIQQINYDGESNFSDEMAFILRANGHGGVDTDTKTQIQAHFDTIRTIVKQWSKGQGELLMGGSMMMGTFTSDSDVDTVCVVPEHIRAEHFFGTVSCHKKFNKECRNDDSLFCQLCLHPDVQSLQKLPSSWVPLIRLTLSTTDHELDIAFASILGDEQIQFEDQNILEKTEEMIDKLGNKIKTLKHDQSDQSAIDESEQLLRSLRSLAGINSNLRMLELVSNNEIFRKFILALKLWAKSNYIYNNAMGFLNGTSLSILATKIVLLYPEATVPFLLKRFFFTYIKWEWPLPVHIEDIRPDSLNWNAADELRQLETQFWLGSHGQRLTMPVITSGYPQQNSTFKINWQTGKIIKNAMQKALKVLHSSKSDKEKWTTILEQQKKFSEMYPYYFVITCVASDVNLFNEFCGFVVTRIRIQLLRTIDCSRDSVEFCHVLALNSCPQYTVQKYTNISANMCCKAWLVGVSVKKAENGQQLQNIDLELNNNNLKTNLDNAIVASYKKIVFDTRRRRGPLNLAEQKIEKFFSSKFSDEKNQRDFVRLETKYVDKSTIT